ncbi:glycine oxidase ThiO [Schaalia sp. ZJ405]|uniref:glycine oxidase ThiO n=1 Tax=Schaalia sp. ZJ405 TaxID=2709403 RepID=UPI0013EC024B|nr:glycine oxidase ThiO [Schaalia sp. ZJ405]QPK81415.1 glycine oxidase ThiO [Schaalia sp. ZJ405]
MKIAIAGAGIIGLSTALTLADRGHSVTVFDPEPMSGASHHAGGMLAPYAEVVYQQDALFPLMRESRRLYPELLRLVTAHTDRPTGYREEGTLVIAADRADAQHLRDLTEYQSARGMRIDPLAVSEARKREPALSARLSGAVSIVEDTQLFPRQFLRALLDAATNLGVTLVKERVTAIDGNTLTTSQRSVEADEIINATGLEAHTLGHWTNHLRPVYGDIVRVRVPDHLYPLVTHVVRGFVEDRPVYIIPREDRTIAIGATTREDGRPEPSVGGMYQLIQDAIRVIPGIEECDFIELTAGARPGTPDDLPYIGRVADHQIVCSGFFRHGILLAALASRVTADIAEHKDCHIDLSACDPMRG